MSHFLVLFLTISASFFSVNLPSTTANSNFFPLPGNTREKRILDII